MVLALYIQAILNVYNWPWIDYFLLVWSLLKSWTLNLTGSACYQLTLKPHLLPLYFNKLIKTSLLLLFTSTLLW
jgi:hypothetical protein